MSKLISIIVPNYNHYTYLEKRLESIFNQTFKDFEVILLDDASTDNSLEILNKYAAHPKVSHFIKNKKNSGSPFKQWEKGIKLAKGDYIWIAESDDYCELNLLEILLSKIKPTTALAYSASINVNEMGEQMGRNKNPDSLDEKRWTMDYYNTGIIEIKDYLRFKNTIPNASAVIFKREYVSASYLEATFVYCGDWVSWIQLLRKGDIYYCAEALNYFRFHKNSTRAKKNIEKDASMFTEFFKVIRMESNTLICILNRKKYNWIIEALISFEKKHEGVSLFRLLQKKDRKLIHYWAVFKRIGF